MADYWRWYVGTLDQELFDWFAAQRPARKTGIVSNSGPGAREAERCWGFEGITDDIVYSHEVGLLKPDPRIFALAAERLGVQPARDRLPRRRPGPRRGGPRGGVARASCTARRRSRSARSERIIEEQSLRR